LGRPTKSGLDFFSHDVNASSDGKIELMIALYGNDGYAFYFRILERIYRSNDLCLDVSSDEMNFVLAKRLDVDFEKFNKMLMTAIQHNLFCKKEYEERKVLTSESIKRRAEPVFVKRMQNRSTTEKVSVTEKKVSVAESTHSKVKNSKGQNSKKVNKDMVEKNFSDDVIFLTDLLISEIKNNNPQAKSPANISNWRNDIKLLMDDGYNHEQIEKVIKWCQADDFWKSNILSAKKLREQMGKLILQMGRGTDAKHWSNNKRPVIEVAKFEGYSENDITPERIEEVRGKAREVEELLRMRKVR
jgi:hypothetical protein